MNYDALHGRAHHVLARNYGLKGVGGHGVLRGFGEYGVGVCLHTEVEHARGYCGKGGVDAGLQFGHVGGVLRLQGGYVGGVLLLQGGKGFLDGLGNVVAVFLPGAPPVAEEAAVGGAASQGNAIGTIIDAGAAIDGVIG